MKLAKYHNLIFISLLLVIFIIPSTYAMDNQTLELIEIEESQSQISVTNDDVLQADNDYYFNSSLENDNGDGSYNNPYKYLTSDRIKGYCNIYLSDGEYELDNSKTIEKVNIIGSNPQKTIIKYDGVAFNVNSHLTLTNVTLVDLSITNNGNFNATNAIFSYGYGSKADDYGNNYGGAVYTTDLNSNSHVTIKNCTFLDNYAVYGGAIYMAAGYLDISNSQFINNCAYNFGGAIACENTESVKISKSKFIKNYCIDDAGGAIYVKASLLNVERSDFINGSATFGGAITTLNSEVTLNYVNAYDNSAKWDGGAIYHMFGKFYSTYGNFNNNSARNGGAIFIDNSSYLFMVSNIFENNNANVSAGAIFSILNNLRYSLSVNTFKNNNAPEYKDYFDTKNLNINIGTGNYSIYTIEDIEVTDLPSYYSLVDDGFVTQVKDQQSSGNCWAFTAIAVLESCLKKATGHEFDLSEENMKNLIALYSDYGWNMVTNEGGYDAMPFGYFASWLGPVDEMSDLFDDKSVLSPILNSILHIQNILFLKRDNYTDNDAIKTAIMKYGAVGTSIYFDSYYLKNGTDYYTWALYPSNHAVTIVGWDDNYSRENFYFGSYADGDGAWIVKNSWGESWGDDGYFYVSYYDESFAKPGVEGIAYTFILNDTVKYDKNYQYDIAGKTDYLHDNRNEVWYKNKFTATDNEILKGVSTYFEKLTNWTFNVYVNNVLKSTKSGISQAGYYTFQLDDIVPLYKGDVFEIVFNTTSDKLSSVPISEIESLNKAIYYPGISYVSYDGENWQDLFYLSKTYALHTYKSQVACIKAFTVLANYNTTISISFDKNQISVRIVDQFNNTVKTGRITINIDNKSQTFDLKEDKLIIPLSLADGSYDVFVEYGCDNYNSSYNHMIIDYKNERINQESVNPNILQLTAQLIDNKDIVMYYGANKIYKVKLTDNSGKIIVGEVVRIIIGKKIYLVKTGNDGFANVKLNKFKINKYTVTAEYKGFKVSNKITVKSTLTAKNKSIKKGKVLKFTAKLVNTKGKPVKGKKITFKIKGKKYSAKTNRKGIATIKIKNLKVGKYKIQTSYGKVKISNKITVKK